MSQFPQIVLKRGKESSILRFHPWVFSGAIFKISDQVTDGCWVEVLDHNQKILGFGHYQQAGSISVRIISFGSKTPDAAFWVGKFQQAVDARKAVNIPREGTNAYRLIHGEGDGLPGLIVDIYDGVAIIQAHSSGMHLDRKVASEALKTVLGDSIHGIYYKSSGTLPGKLRLEQPDEYLFGMSTVPHLVLENEVKFSVDWEEGQKTGFFLDQRENRALVGQYSKGKRVLNTFCYSGGFSVYALLAGASEVYSIDSSQKAIDLTRKNLELNGFDSTKNPCLAMDTFDFLQSNSDSFELIILDPPAFAKHRDAKHQAMKGYQRLNAEAIKSIQSGGILFTFSCSQVIDAAMFYSTVTSAAIQTGRTIKVLHRLSQPPDHPVSIYHPEGEYLKGLALQVF